MIATLANGTAGEAPCWWNMLVSWAPFVLLILFWVFFMRAAKKGASTQRDLQERQRLHMERIEALLERAVSALERKSGP
jgi:ATP-dependent Zn protease